MFNKKFYLLYFGLLILFCSFVEKASHADQLRERLDSLHNKASIYLSTMDEMVHKQFEATGMSPDSINGQVYFMKAEMSRGLALIEVETIEASIKGDLCLLRKNMQHLKTFYSLHDKTLAEIGYLSDNFFAFFLYGETDKEHDDIRKMLISFDLIFRNEKAPKTPGTPTSPSISSCASTSEILHDIVPASIDDLLGPAEMLPSLPLEFDADFCDRKTN